MPVPATDQIQYQQGGAFDPKLPVRFTARVQFDGDVNILDTVTVNATVANDNSTHFLTVEGTLPPSLISNPQGVVFNIASSGSSAAGQEGVFIFLAGGYTGSGYSEALNVANSAAGTNTDLFIGGNAAVFAGSTATTSGTNMGFQSDARGGNISVGIACHATIAKNSATNGGGAFFGRNTGTTPIQFGVYAGLNDSNPTFESAGLIADNSDQTSPILLARDNGTKVWTIQDGGSVQGKMGAKTLTEGVATGFVRVACAQGATTAGFVKYSIEANDGADFQARSGLLPFAIVNKAGTETGAVATVSTATETVAVSAGTLTNTFTIASNAADTMDILANATSSLAQTTLRINYTVELYGNAIVAVTPL